MEDWDVRMYMGPDEPMSGLIHGKKYNVKETKLSSGRIRVDLDHVNSDVLIRKMTFDSADEYNRYFRPMAKRKEPNGKRKRA